MEESIYDMLLDEENCGNITLYNENNEAVEFIQIAVVPIDDDLYAILKPATEIEGVAEDEAIVFAFEEHEGEESMSIVTDDEVIDLVFEEYYRLLRESGTDVD